MKTYASSATKRCAVASPIPLLPPVMTAIFPSSLVTILSYLISCLCKMPFHVRLGGALQFHCKVPRCQHIAQPNPTKTLGADTVRNSIDDHSTVQHRINLHAESQ